MAKYDVCAIASGSGLVLDVQTDILGPLNTRVVVPLMPLASAPKPARRLNPIFDIDGTQLVMATQFASAVLLADLGKPVASLEPRAEDITLALDMLFQGF